MCKSTDGQLSPGLCSGGCVQGGDPWLLPGYHAENSRASGAQSVHCRWMGPLGHTDSIPTLRMLLLANYSFSVYCLSAQLVCELTRAELWETGERAGSRLGSPSIPSAPWILSFYLLCGSPSPVLRWVWSLLLDWRLQEAMRCCLSN